MPRPVRPSLCTLCRLCALPSLASLYFNGPLVVPFPRFRVHLFSTFFAIKEGLSLPPAIRIFYVSYARTGRDIARGLRHGTYVVSYCADFGSCFVFLSLFKGGSSCFLVYFIWRKIRFHSIFGREKYTIGCFCLRVIMKEVESLAELINRWKIVLSLTRVSSLFM